MDRLFATLLAAAALGACSRPPARTNLDQPTASPSATATSQAAVPSPAAVTPADLTAIAPELSASSASLLIARFGDRYASPEAITEAGIATASVGFRTLDTEVAREAGALLEAAYGTLKSGGRDRVGAYLDRVRSGAVTPAESREGRHLFTEALRGLSEARRARLASLYERAIAAGLEEQAAAQARTLARTAEAMVTGPPAVDASAGAAARATRIGPGDPALARGPSSSLPTRGQAYWSAEAQRRKARLAALEKELAALEAEAERTGKVVIPFGTLIPDSVYERRDFVKRRTAEIKGLLDPARRSVLDVEYDCVHDNGLPGWVR